MATTYTIRITKQAKEQLVNIRTYISNELHAPEAAANIIRTIRYEIQGLSEMPSRIKLTEEEPWRSEGIRRMRVKNYYVYFWTDDVNHTVQIIAVIYVTRDQMAQLNQLLE